MLLSEMLEYLTHSELSNHFISGDDEEGIRERDYPKIIANINLAMIDMHKKLPILMKQVNIQMFQHIGDYILDKKYSVVNADPSVTYRYISDSVYYPFENDVVRITRVVSEDDVEYPLNVNNNVYSLFTPSYNRIQVPYPLNENIIGVEYQAFPVKIPMTITDTTTYEVDFPEILMEPLISYLNYKMYANVGSDKPEQGIYLAKYEREVKNLLDLGVFNFETNQNLRLENNGWV